MAEKKSGTDKKNADQTRAEAAEALKRAAELIASLNSATEEPAAAPKKKTTSSGKSASSKTAGTKTAAKKPAAKPAAKKAEEGDEKPKTTAAKKPAAKSASASKSSSTKKPATKSATTKSAAAKTTAAKPKKAPVKKEEPVAEEPVREEEIAAVNEAPAAEEPVKEAEKPSQDQAPAENPEPIVEEKAEEPKLAVEEPPAEEKKEEPAPVQEQPVAAATETKERPTAVAAETKVTTTEVKTTEVKRSTVAEKASKTLDKGKLPIFIAVNALFVLSAVLLLVSAFGITSYVSEKSVNYNLFGYFQNATTIKDMLAHTALQWSDGAFIVIGVLMVLAALVPLALVIKNLIILIVKKSKQVYKLDAIVSVSFMLAYLAIVGLFGANITAGQIVAFIVALISFAFTVLTLTLSRNDAKIPFFSFAVIVGVIVSILLLSQTPVYNASNGSWFVASASSEVGGAGALIFITVLVAVFALVALALTQIKRLPKVLQILVPAVALVCSVIALAVSASSMPANNSMGGGFICGVVITCITCLVDALFVAVKPLNKFVVYLENDQAKAEDARQNDVVTETVTTTTVTTTVAVSDNESVCPKCGGKNSANAKFCYKCGEQLKND